MTSQVKVWILCILDSIAASQVQRCVQLTQTRRSPLNHVKEISCVLGNFVHFNIHPYVGYNLFSKFELGKMGTFVEGTSGMYLNVSLHTPNECLRLHWKS